LYRGSFISSDLLIRDRVGWWKVIGLCSEKLFDGEEEVVDLFMIDW